MGKNSQKRRAAQQRRSSQHQRSDGAPSQSRPSAPLSHTDIAQLITVGAYFAFGRDEHKSRFTATIELLVGLETAVGTEPAARPSWFMAEQLQRSTTGLCEAGWQPADIAHVVKRNGTARSARLAVVLIAHHARITDAVHRAPRAWLNQLDDLGVYDTQRCAIVGGHDRPVESWIRTERLDPDEVFAIALQVLGVLITAPPQSVLIPVPSTWGASNRGVMPSAAARTGEVDAKALKLIRALLAKAEATNFDAEAESFTAKAQEMMTRYSIDAAVLASAAMGPGGSRKAGIESRRVHIESPYADEKAGLLSVIASVNSARCIWSPSLGIATVMGFPVDLQLTDMLFTSLLVQATRASADATANEPRLRTPSFRRAFLIAFADRIGERLEATREHASVDAEQRYGSALVPILADRATAVDEAFSESFPHAVSAPMRRVNAAGWHAGRTAADRAHIGAGAAITAG